MKTIRFPLATLILIGLLNAALFADDLIDQIDDHLTINAFHGAVRARLSGLLDLEAYRIEQPPPGLILTDEKFFFNPRLTLFLDAQIGPHLYAFTQTRVDRGFDPGTQKAEIRMDEYAMRFTPWEDGRLNIQIGKFATVVGNWVGRHYSWDNPFITAPLPYENLTGVWDSSAPDSATTLLGWAHVLPAQEHESALDQDSDKYLRNPVIWGPSYASGIAVSGRLGKIEYAAELKNASLSSRPESWDVTETGFAHPTFSTRLGFRPNPTWNFGFSASAGPYYLPQAAPTLPHGKDLGDYRELVLGQDISFAWHHLQVWAEFYETRFEVPNIGNADTFAYYIEAKYKFAPQLFGALRWNQQLYASVRDDQGGRATWGDDLWRIDAALGYRLTPHIQLKLQYSLDRHEMGSLRFGHTVAGQFTLKF